MKIAFLTPEFPHPRTGPAGGIGTGIFNLCKGLIAQGHQPVILIYSQASDEYFEDGGIQFHLIKNMRFKGLSWLLTRKKIQQVIKRLHKSGEIDIVEAPDWTGISAFIDTKCPIVIRLHGSDTYFCHLDKRPVNPFNKFLEKAALQQANGHISVSAFTAKVTNEVFGLNKDFTIIPNSIEAANFKPSNANTSSNTILYFGTLIRKKGLLELPHIFNRVVAQHPDARLILAGRDSGDIESGSPSTWELMKPLFTQSAFLNVSYIGPVEYSSISGLIAKAAVCVFPTFAEALPLSWLEAMAMEKAIVASSIGWAPEIIDDGNSGFLAHPKDHDEFAQKISSLLADAQLRGSMGKMARESVLEKFDNGPLARRSVEFYSKFI